MRRAETKLELKDFMVWI